MLEALLSSPGVELASIGPQWSKLKQLCIDRQLRGIDVPDAWLAAAIMRLGEHLVSFDRDFKGLLPRDQFTLLTVRP
jgi:uncharacterized protein